MTRSLEKGGKGGGGQEIMRLHEDRKALIPEVLVDYILFIESCRNMDPGNTFAFTQRCLDWSCPTVVVPAVLLAETLSRFRHNKY